MPARGHPGITKFSFSERGKDPEVRPLIPIGHAPTRGPSPSGSTAVLAPRSVAYVDFKSTRPDVGALPCDMFPLWGAWPFPLNLLEHSQIALGIPPPNCQADQIQPDQAQDHAESKDHVVGGVGRCVLYEHRSPPGGAQADSILSLSC